MKYLTLLLLCLNVSALAAQDQQAAPSLKKHELIAGMVLNKLYPEFTVKSRKLRLNQDSLKNKVTVLNFWFEACPPCQAEMEGLNALYQDLKDSLDFRFYAFTFEDASTIKRLTKNGTIRFPAYALTSDETSRLSFGAGYPTNIIIDRQGVIRYFRAGGSRNKEEAARYLNEHIKPLIISLYR